MNTRMPSDNRTYSEPSNLGRVQAEELILCDHPDFVCETYVFEPSPGEEKLGYLFAAAETENRGGIGSELLDVVMSAVQNEYYRDPSRSPVRSFELALHQANLILHDSAESGVRDWMGYFHVSIGAMVGSTLHISVAGEAGVFIVRRNSFSNIAGGLSHSPITNPLRTFSQVASGEISPQDTVFFATSMFGSIYASDEVSRFTIDKSAETITGRMKQLYKDQRQQAPLSFVTMRLQSSNAPEESLTAMNSRAGERMSPSARAGIGREHSSPSSEHLQPRKPLLINRNGAQRLWVIVVGISSFLWRTLRNYIWPAVKQGSSVVGRQVQRGGSAVVSYSRDRFSSQGDVSAIPSRLSFGQRISSAWASFWSFVSALPLIVLRGIVTMPTTSKIFAGLAVLLLIILLSSVFLLQSKRADDQDIQRASELLHDARTKKDAAETALIYDNREQARLLLDDAQKEIDTLSGTGLYTEELAELQQQIQSQTDRLQKISRPQDEAVRTVGTFSDLIADTEPTSLFYVDGNFYTYNPNTNAVVAMSTDGTTSIASEDTKEIGFFTGGVAHSADKSIIFTTNEGGLAIFDAKTSTISRQEVALSQENPTITTLAPFGNRLYLFEKNEGTILSLSKTLRGYVNATPWISDTTFPSQSITSLAVDGSIYTLHSDGVIRELFKGEPSDDFTMESIEPSLSPASTLTTDEDLKYIYVLDPDAKRVVIFTKQGALVRQVFLDETSNPVAMTVSPEEDALNILSDSTVIEVSLLEGV